MSNNKVKSITQRYKNVTYRSRLEVLIAKMLEQYNINFSYETEGYVLSNDESTICYEPDFLLTEQGCILEGKGVMDEASLKKITMLSMHTDVYVLMYPFPTMSLYRNGEKSKVDVVMNYCSNCNKWTISIKGNYNCSICSSDNITYSHKIEQELELKDHLNKDIYSTQKAIQNSIEKAIINKSQLDKEELLELTNLLNNLLSIKNNCTCTTEENSNE